MTCTLVEHSKASCKLITKHVAYRVIKLTRVSNAPASISVILLALRSLSKDVKLVTKGPKLTVVIATETYNSSRALVMLVLFL
jgi:hypothetical protein